MEPSQCLVSTNKTQSAQCVSRDSLIYVTTQTRVAFLVVFTMVSTFSLVGNVAVLISIKNRKFKLIQKVCIACLSCSDILSTLTIALNNIDALSKPEMIWNLGTFLCFFIPMCQMAGILFSSIALLFIAIDRYRNVVTALTQRWNPHIYTCFIVIFFITVLVFGVSYPMYDFFELRQLIIVDFTETSYSETPVKVCLSFRKEDIRAYYISMTIIIFLPLTLTFIWLNIKIATMVWKHRKPPLSQDKAEHSECSVKTSSAGPTLKRAIKKCKDVRMERKIRTFKIVIALVVVFIACRLPYFGIFLLKLSLDASAGQWIWDLNYFSIVLHVFNCGLNPLLYAFLNQTINFIFRSKKLFKSFISEICCFCFGKSEFDELQRENPFVIPTREGEQKDKYKDLY